MKTSKGLRPSGVRIPPPPHLILEVSPRQTAHHHIFDSHIFYENLCYSGTQWLPHSSVNRTKLGHGNEGKSDEESGLFLNKEDIEQLDTGHIALLKGDAWSGNEGLGIVHRSPHAEDHYKRLYMTVDFVDLYLSIFQNFLKNQ